VSRASKSTDQNAGGKLADVAFRLTDHAMQQPCGRCPWHGWGAVSRRGFRRAPQL